jgi:hypothetical protein
MKVIEPVEAEEDDSFGGKLDKPVFYLSQLIKSDMSVAEPSKVTSLVKTAPKTAPRLRKEDEEEEPARPVERKGPSGEPSKKLNSVS